MKLRILSYLSFLIILISSSIQASVVPGRWEKLESLPPGRELEVRLNSKERLEGQLLEVEVEELVLNREEDGELRLPKSQIVKVTSRDRIARDSAKDGLLWEPLWEFHG